jgi:hypothetical protein
MGQSEPYGINSVDHEAFASTTTGTSARRNSVGFAKADGPIS